MDRFVGVELGGDRCTGVVTKNRWTPSSEQRVSWPSGSVVFVKGRKSSGSVVGFLCFGVRVMEVE